MPDADPRPASASPGTPAAIARRRAIVGLLCALAVAALLTIAVSSGSHWLDGFDSALTDLTRGWADPLGWPVDISHILGLVTAPFWSAVAATALVIALLLAHHRAAAGMLAMSGIAGVTVSETVKMTMGRQRPPGAEQFEQDLDKSFPSGHAMEGIYLYMATGLILIHLGRSHGRRWMEVVGRLLVILGPLIGLSRLVLGVHWPSDIIAGWAFGSVVLLASALVLWWPLDRGWTVHPGPVRSAPTPQELPGAGTRPGPPER